MKRSIKALSLLMALILLLSGCNAGTKTEASTVTTQAPTTAPATEPPTEPEPEPEPINTEETLRAALEAGGRVVLEGDIQLTELLPVKGNLFDGGGYTITGREYVEDDDTTHNGVMVTSGTVENLRIVGAYKCIGDCTGYGASNDVRIKNVYLDPYTVALNFGRGDGSGSLYVENSTLLGWVLHSKMKEVIFKDCTFGRNTRNSGGDYRAYCNATLIGCNFESYFDESGKETKYTINFNSSTKGVILTLEDCYVNGTLITESNISTLLKLKNVKNNTIRIQNSTT